MEEQEAFLTRMALMKRIPGGGSYLSKARQGM